MAFADRFESGTRPSTRSVMSDDCHECFICTDSTPAPRKSACLCVDRYVHDACLVKMLENATEITCPVCKATYSNVTCKSRVVGVRCCSPGAFISFLVVAVFVMLTCAVNTFLVTHGTRRLNPKDFAVALGAAVLMTIFSVVALVIIVHSCLSLGVRSLWESAIVRRAQVDVAPTGVYLSPVDARLGVFFNL